MNQQLISQYLQLLRKKKGYTQSELAAKLSVTRQAVSKWETGSTLPDLEALLGLSKLYGTTINDLLEPSIPKPLIESFEQIPEVETEQLHFCLSGMNHREIVKAAMGSSPGVNESLAKALPEIDFPKVREETGPVRIEEVEELQKQILCLINQLNRI